MREAESRRDKAGIEAKRRRRKKSESNRCEEQYVRMCVWEAVKETSGCCE